ERRDPFRRSLAPRRSPGRGASPTSHRGGHLPREAWPPRENGNEKVETITQQNAQLRNLLQRAVLILDDLRPDLDLLDRIDRLTYDVARLATPTEDVEPSSDEWTRLPCGARVRWLSGQPAEVDDGAAL